MVLTHSATFVGYPVLIPDAGFGERGPPLPCTPAYVPAAFACCCAFPCILAAAHFAATPAAAAADPFKALAWGHGRC